MKGLIAKKLGMTSIFDAKGVQVPCTILQADPCHVTQIKTVASDGYNAVQLAVEDKKSKHTNKSEAGHFAKSGVSPKRYVKEFVGFHLEKNVGDVVACDIFSEEETVVVVGTTKGKGFQGVVKRHGFAGVGEATHGQHDRSRAPGSVGGSSYPSRVFKGMRMAGRTGGRLQKVKGLKIVKIYPEKNYILVKGAVPGHNNSIVYIQSK